MSYTEKTFWDLYGDYLKESEKRHRFAVHTLTALVPRAEKLLDLGCGKFQSADDLIVPLHDYFGVDSAISPYDRDRNYAKGALLDYRKEFYDIADVLHFPPDCFSSFFSSEITAPWKDNYVLYQNLFKVFPSIKWGLVSGFYYTDHRKGKNPVEEAGGLLSYQTLEGVEDTENHLFSETRLTLPAPSTMFGPTVIEVWKLFVRKDGHLVLEYFDGRPVPQTWVVHVDDVDLLRKVLEKEE